MQRRLAAEFCMLYLGVNKMSLQKKSSELKNCTILDILKINLVKLFQTYKTS